MSAKGIMKSVRTPELMQFTQEPSSCLCPYLFRPEINRQHLREGKSQQLEDGERKREKKRKGPGEVLGHQKRGTPVSIRDIKR